LTADGFLFDLLELCDVRALSIRKTADLPLQFCVGTFPRFVAIGFYFLLLQYALGMDKQIHLPQKTG
jgi:hypothetical protein